MTKVYGVSLTMMLVNRIKNLLLFVILAVGGGPGQERETRQSKHREMQGLLFAFYKQFYNIQERNKSKALVAKYSWESSSIGHYMKICKNLLLSKKELSRVLVKSSLIIECFQMTGYTIHVFVYLSVCNVKVPTLWRCKSNDCISFSWF